MRNQVREAQENMRRGLYEENRSWRAGVEFPRHWVLGGVRKERVSPLVSAGSSSVRVDGEHKKATKALELCMAA